MDVRELLDAAKERTGSDSATAKAIGATKQRVSHWRNGREPLPLYEGAKLSELIGQRWYDPAIKILADQAKDAVEKEYWLGKFAELRKAAGVVLIIVAAILVNPNDANANQLAPKAHQSSAITELSGLYNAHDIEGARLARPIGGAGACVRYLCLLTARCLRLAPQNFTVFENGGGFACIRL